MAVQCVRHERFETISVKLKFILKALRQSRVFPPNFPEQRGDECKVCMTGSQNGPNYEGKIPEFSFLKKFLFQVFSRYDKTRIAVRVSPPVYLKLFALLSCMSVHCVQLQMSTETWSQALESGRWNTWESTESKYGWWFSFCIITLLLLRPSLHPRLRTSKVWVLWFPCISKAVKGVVSTTLPVSALLQPERPRRLLLGVFKKWKKKKKKRL